MGALIACAMGGVLLGDLTIFTIGRRHGDWVFRSRFLAWLLPERRLARARRLFAEHGPKVIFFGRFVAGLRFVVFFTAGNLGVPALTFFSFDLLAALITVPVSVYAAHRFGGDIERAILFARHSQRVVLLVAAGAVAIALLVRHARARHADQGGGAVPEVAGDPSGRNDFSESGRFSAREDGAGTGGAGGAAG